MDALEVFVDSANRLHMAAPWWQLPPAPQWLQTKAPYMTTRSVVEDMLAHLRPLVGRRLGSHMLMMATFDEYTVVVKELYKVARDEFVQKAMDATGIARPLASLHLKFDVPGFAALERGPVVATSSGHQVFT
jgi:hypothetical protein